MRLRAKQAMISLTTPIAGKNHDVNGRVRVEPEQMLEEDGSPPSAGIEDADAEELFEATSSERDGQHRRAEHQDEARGVQRPEKSGRRNQVMPGARILWIVTMKFSPVRIDEKPVMKMPNAVGDHVRVGIACCKACKTSSRCRRRRRDRPQRERAADHVEVPARRLSLRKGQVLRPDHQRHEKIAQHRRDGRDQEKEHHHHAVQR